MKTGRHSKKRQQQQQSGRAVLVTFYVARPRRKHGGGAPAGSSRHVHHHHHHEVHHHHHHHLLHHRLRGGSHEAGRRGSENRRSYDRRAELLEYSRQMRAAAAAATARPVHPEPLPPRLDVEAGGAGRYPVHPPPADDPRFIYIAGLIESLSGGAVRLGGHPPAAGDDRRLAEVDRRRLERAESQQQVRHRCLGLGGDWSWKSVLRLVLPCQSSSARPSTRSRTRRRDDNDGKEDGKAARAWPAAIQLVSKSKVNRTGRRTSNGDDEGLLKKLFSTFERQRSRPSR